MNGTNFHEFFYQLQLHCIAGIYVRTEPVFGSEMAVEKPENHTCLLIILLDFHGDDSQKVWSRTIHKYTQLCLYGNMGCQVSKGGIQY